MLHQAQSAERMEVVLLAAFGRDSAIEIRAITHSHNANTRVYALLLDAKFRQTYYLR